MKRYAIVRGASSQRQLENYLPANYIVIHDDVGLFVIEGTDYAGWTLDAYVSPRLGSGNMSCEEIDLSHPVMKTIPA